MDGLTNMKIQRNPGGCSHIAESVSTHSDALTFQTQHCHIHETFDFSIHPRSV